jgi:TPR repeat protein
MKSDEAVLYSNRAFCENQLENFESAREDAEHAIRLDPQNAKFYHILSEALLGLQSHEKALEACEKGLSLDPEDTALLTLQQEWKLRTSGSKQQPQVVGVQNEAATHLNGGRKGHSAEMTKIEFSTPTSDDILIAKDADLIDNLNVCAALSFLAPFQYNEKSALHFLQLAVDRGHPRALYHKGMMYYHGKAGFSCDPQTALQLWKKAAACKPHMKLNKEIIRRVGVGESANAIGNAYRDGKGVEQNDAEAFKWYQKAAQLGCPGGCANLSSFLDAGRACQKDPVAAKMWLKKISECTDNEGNWETIYHSGLPCDNSFQEDDNSADPVDVPEDSVLDEEYEDDAQMELLRYLQAPEDDSDSSQNPNSIVYNPTLLIPLMKERLKRGWPSAKLFFDAYQQMNEAHELLRERKFTESFVKVLEMSRNWILKFFNPVNFISAAKVVLSVEPNNMAALYIIVTFDVDQNYKQKLASAKRLVKSDPSVPEYYSMLSASFAGLGQGNEALKNVEKALKLRPNPRMMYSRAIIIQAVICAGDDAAIEAYQQFLSSAPSDYESVAEAYFNLGFYSFKKGDLPKAAALYRMGQIADHSSIRLPCLPDLRDDEIRLMLKKCLKSSDHWPISKDALYAVKMCFTCTKTGPLSPCTTCNKAWYCSEQCQENNVIIHRRFCLH